MKQYPSIMYKNEIRTVKSLSKFEWLDHKIRIWFIDLRIYIKQDLERWFK